MTPVKKRWSQFFRSSSFMWLVPVAICVIWVVVVWQNFRPDLWLSGWDNLHPEFNFAINIERAFWGAWQSHQGLGHLGGHGYAATLLHTVFLAASSLIIPHINLRFLFNLLMLLVGSLGVWQLGIKLFAHSKNRHWIALIASVIYMLHLGTVQNFYFPLEAFTIFHGLLPWVLLRLDLVLEKPTPLNWWWFFLISILFTPTGFIPPLFIVYLIVAGGWLITDFFQKRKERNIKSILRKSLLVLCVIFVTNAYWLLPVGYFTLTSADVYLESHNNLLSTTDFNLQSQAFGDVQNVSLLRGFVFDSLDSPSTHTGSAFYAMQTWIDHFSHNWVLLIGYILFGLVLTGAIRILWTKKYHLFPLIWMLIFTWVALGQKVFPFSWLSELLQHIPIINQAFRASFTKVSVVGVLSYALLASYGFGELYQLVIKNITLSFVKIVIPALMLVALVGYSWPIFTGNLFYDRLKQDTPQEYFQTISYLNTQEQEGKVLLLPLTWNWGWEITDWDFTGSGFWWYGVNKPIIHRSFDAWSKENETAYLQLRTAIEHDSPEDFYKLLTQYGVGYVILDKHQLLPGFDQTELNIDQLQGYLQSIPHISYGDITVYTLSEKSEIWSPASYSQAGSYQPYLQKDFNYLYEGNYMNGNNEIYPFEGLLSTRKLDDVVNISDQHISVKKAINIHNDSTLVIPGHEYGDKLSVKVQSLNAEGTQGNITFQTNEPIIAINDSTIKDSNTHQLSFPIPTDRVEFEQHDQLLVALNSELVHEGSVHSLIVGEPLTIHLFSQQALEAQPLTEALQNQQHQQCWTREGYEGFSQKKSIDNGVALTAEDASACITHRLGYVPAGQAQLVKLNFEFQSNQDMEPDVCLIREEDDQRTCYNDLPSTISTHEDWKLYDQSVVLNRAGTYWLDIAGNSGGAIHSRATSQYRNMQLLTEKELLKNNYSTNVWDASLETKEFELDELDAAQLEVTVPVFNSYTRNGTSSVDNCSYQNKGTVSTTQLLDGVKYQASNRGVACDTILLDGAKSNSNYLFTVSAENMSNRGLKFYLRNGISGKNILEELDDTTGLFTDTYSIFGTNTATTDITADIEVRSFQNQTNEVLINNVQLSPYPLDQIASISLRSKELSLSNQETLHLKVESSKIAYKKIRTSGEGVVILSEGYNEGWLALSHPTNKLWWDIQAYTLLTHSRFNGWANAWQVPKGEHTIVFIYWPQLLVFGGYMLLGGTFIYLAISVITNKHQRIGKHSFDKHGMNRKANTTSQILLATKHRLRGER